MDNILVIFIILFCTVVILWHQHYIDLYGTDNLHRKIFNISNKNASPTNGANTAGSCDINSCGSVDPVSDPKYNMQQIIKQSILLEEHLTNKNKRCRDCITKHFLHIIGLAEEAQMLATNKISEYPMINESVIIYTELFNIWINNHDMKDDKTILYITDKLRDNRKKLIVVYFFDEKYKLKQTK
jgi:hypothetical protein